MAGTGAQAEDPLLRQLAQPLDRSSGLSVATQLTWRLRRLMGSGALEAGARLPSARDLAREVGVNPNTVFSVYSRLERDGLIDSHHGRGSFVRADARGSAALIALAEETAAAARAAGLDPRELAMSVFVTPLPEPLPSGEHAAAQPSPAPLADREERRLLRAEIAELEHRLASLETLLPARTAAGSGPRIPGTSELRETRDALRERLAAAGAEREQLATDVRARRAAAQTSTLEHATARPGERAAPLTVRWTPAWRMA